MKSSRLRSTVAAFAATIAPVVAACGGGQADLPGQREATALRLYVLDCGTLKADPGRFRLKSEEVATTDLSVPCFLIVHPRGRLIWDAGAFRTRIGRRPAAR